MEQSGFRPDQQQAYQGAKYGWQKFFAGLERVVGNASPHRRLDGQFRKNVPFSRMQWRDCIEARQC